MPRNQPNPQPLRIKQSILIIGGALILAGGMVVLLAAKPSPEPSSNPVETAAPQAATPPLVAAPLYQAPTHAAPDKSTQILELFNPSDQALTHQLNDTVLSQQVEQMLTASFVLTQCGLITQTNYRDTFRALILFAQLNHMAADEPSAEARVRKIAESAGASYSLIYSRTDCRDPDLRTRAAELLGWQQAMLRDR